MADRASAAPVRAAIRILLKSVFPPDPRAAERYDAPCGDPGWFGPDSVTWRVHADFPAMMTGGLCALYLQTLHPRALAGVYDHSNFRHNLLGRLRRTTTFVAATTYAGADAADALAARVRAIHRHVYGTDEMGRPYAAGDADLLRWVHVTEVSSFLAGYRRYGPLAIPRSVADAYYAEVARIGVALGACDLPSTENDVRDYFRAVQPELGFGARSREVINALERVVLPVPLSGLARGLFLGAGAALLPDWAKRLLDRSTRDRGRAAASATALARMAPAIRAALDGGLAARAMRRCNRDPAALGRWPSPAHQDQPAAGCHLAR